MGIIDYGIDDSEPTASGAGTTIELGPLDAAFIVKEDLKLEAVIPQFDDDAPDNVRMVAGLMVLLSQEETYDVLMMMISDALEGARALVEDGEETQE
jgi:hypothetical protein